MSPLEHTFQASLRVRAAEEFAEPAEGEFVFHAVFEPTAVFAVGDKEVGVLPFPKWAGDHDIAEHAARFAGGVLGGPGLREGTDAKLDFNARTNLFDAAGLFDDFGIFPRRCQTGESVWPGVKIVQGLRGDRHGAAVDEEFSHRP